MAQSDGSAELLAYARALVDGIDAALEGWVVRSIEARCRAAGVVVDAGVHRRAQEAGALTRRASVPVLHAVLEDDLDEQHATPLELLRAGIGPATDALRALGVPPARRSEIDAELYPDDAYDLNPRTLADVDPELTELGVHWGAAKAFVFLERRRAEGRL